MFKKRSLIKLYTSLVILFFIGVPGISISDDAEKTVQQPIKSASELDYPPFSIVRSDGTADGFSVELLRSVANSIGKDISFFVGPWHEIKQNLIEGHLDVLPLVSYSKERDEI